MTDSHGKVRFLTIYPGSYVGRTVHIHFRVRKFSGVVTTLNFVSQLYFTQSITNTIDQREAPYNMQPIPGTNNSNDMLYNSALLLRLADNQSHAIASFNVVLGNVTSEEDDVSTPTDGDSLEHADDFGGGTPSLAEIERH